MAVRMSPKIQPTESEMIEQALARKYTDIDVVKLVSNLGARALGQFVADLRPHLMAVQRHEDGAAEALAGYLHDSAVSAVVLIQAGGVDEFRKAEEAAAAAPPEKAEDGIARMERLFEAV